MKMKLWLLLVALTVGFSSGDVYAQKRSSSSKSSGSSSKSSGSSSKPSAPKASPTPKPSPTPAAKPAPKTDSKEATPSRGESTGKPSAEKGTWGSSETKAGKSKPASAVDKKTYENAKTKGLAFNDRQSAETDFKKKNAQNYKSSYASEPSVRPSHIPQTTTHNGQNVNIVYNQQGGGYGFWTGVGTFMLYDAMNDMAMASYFDSQMRNSGYYYGPPPPAGATGAIVLSLIVAIVIVAIILAARKS